MEEADGSEQKEIEEGEKSSGFDFSSVMLPRPGEKLTIEGQETEVQEPLGRNGRPLRSKFYDLGTLFKPPTKLGHNFRCCVPVVDKTSGEMRPCGVLLKIPTGSLGNPLRHVKLKHPRAYRAVKGEERKRGSGSLSNPLKRGKFDGVSTSAAASSKDWLVRKCVVFCAKQLTPLDAMKTKEFNSFITSFDTFKSHLAQIPDDADSSTVQEMYECLERESKALSDRIGKRTEEISSDFYCGLPFLDVVIDPEFTPTPLVRLTFLNDQGEREEFNLVTCGAAGGKDLAAACGSEIPARESQEIASQVKQVLADYNLEDSWSRVLTISLGYRGWERRREIPATSGFDQAQVQSVVAYLSPPLSASDRTAMAEGRAGATRLFALGARFAIDRDRVSGDFVRELDAYEVLAMGVPGAQESASPVSAAAWWRETGKANLPNLYRVACSIQAACSALPLGPVQTAREARIIEAKDFLAETWRDQHARYTKPTLLLKYNKDAQA